MNLYKVFQNGAEIKINTAKIRPVPYNSEKIQEFAICDFGGDDVIEITVGKIVKNVVIRPLSAEIGYMFDEHKIVIRLTNFLNGLDDESTIQNPVVIDTFTGYVYKISAEQIDNWCGNMLIRGLPFADYPCIICDKSDFEIVE